VPAATAKPRDLKAVKHMARRSTTSKCVEHAECSGSHL
jgi:hypothetical protein